MSELKPQFSIQTIRAIEETHYRITHTETDSRVATCYDYLNAVYVCEALNHFVNAFGRKYIDEIRKGVLKNDHQSSES